MKCPNCKQEYSPSCDWNQGRCPNHPPMVTKSSIKQAVILYFAPLICVWWCMRNPKRLWELAKKEYNIK